MAKCELEIVELEEGVESTGLYYVEIYDRGNWQKWVTSDLDTIDYSDYATIASALEMHVGEADQYVGKIIEAYCGDDCGLHNVKDVAGFIEWLGGENWAEKLGRDIIRGWGDSDLDE